MTARRALAAVLLTAASAVTATACGPAGSGVTYYEVCPAGQHAVPIQGAPGQEQCAKDTP